MNWRSIHWCFAALAFRLSELPRDELQTLFYDQSNLMTRRFQFSLRAMFAVVAVAAVVAWLIKLLGPVALLLASLACLPAAGPLFRRPLEGILAVTFLLIVATWVGMAVLVVALGD